MKPATAEYPIHLRAVLDAAEAPSALRSKPLRHTYITARLQTLDRGQPVSLWAVVREVGHASTQMIERIYGHLGEVLTVPMWWSSASNSMWLCWLILLALVGQQSGV